MPTKKTNCFANHRKRLKPWLLISIPRDYKIMFRIFQVGKNVCPASKNPPPPFCCHVTCGAFPNARGCPVIELFAITCWRKRGVALHPFPLVEAYPRWNFLSGSCGPRFDDSDVSYAMPIDTIKLFREPWEEARTLIAHSDPRDYKIMFRIFQVGKNVRPALKKTSATLVPPCHLRSLSQCIRLPSHRTLRKCLLQKMCVRFGGRWWKYILGGTFLGGSVVPGLVILMHFMHLVCILQRSCAH